MFIQKVTIYGSIIEGGWLFVAAFGVNYTKIYRACAALLVLTEPINTGLCPSVVYNN